MKRFGPALIRTSMGIVAVVTSLAILNFLSKSRAAHEQALSAWQESHRIASEIEQFRSGIRMASIDVEPPERIAIRVTEAASQADVSPNSILSIAPQSLVRLGRSPYQSRATQIVLQNVTLAQSAHFVESLEDPAEGSVVRDWVISRSRVLGNDGSELWNIRLTLTQLVFSPISSR